MFFILNLDFVREWWTCTDGWKPGQAWLKTYGEFKALLSRSMVISLLASPIFLIVFAFEIVEMITDIALRTVVAAILLAIMAVGAWILWAALHQIASGVSG